jgi:co-chaperonin GroES (HSP10)
MAKITKHFIEPTFDRVLIRQFDAVKEINGVLVPDGASDKPKEGVVVAVGPLVWTQARVAARLRADNLTIRGDSELVDKALADRAKDELMAYPEQTVELGDHVLFGAYAGAEITVDEGTKYAEKFMLMNQKEINGIVRAKEVEVKESNE